MPLSAQRRHSRDCSKKHHYKPTQTDKCDCPMMIVGKDRHGVYHDKEHAFTRDEFECREVIQDIQKGRITRPQAATSSWTIEQCLDKFRTIMIKQRGLKPNSIKNHKVVHNSLIRFAKEEGIEYLKEFDGDKLSEWVNSWDVKLNTRSNQTNLVKRMFSIAHSLKWIPHNPAVTLMHPMVKHKSETEPFELEEELPLIMDAVPHWKDGMLRKRTRKLGVWTSKPEIATALIMVLRCTGLRISDAFLFNPSVIRKRIINGKEIYCYFMKEQKKTENPVFIPIEPKYAEIILNTEWISEEYAFWDGETDLEQWYHGFCKAVMVPLGRLCKVKKMTPHRFRDTFAVDLLDKYVDIRIVSRLLGHAKLSTTFDYYMHHIKSDQDRLLTAMLDSMGADTRPKNVVSIQKSA